VRFRRCSICSSRGARIAAAAGTRPSILAMLLSTDCSKGARSIRSPYLVGSQRRTQELSTMARGMVKWFNPTKGYGFIQPQGGGKDEFVHIKEVQLAGLRRKMASRRRSTGLGSARLSPQRSPSRATFP
jgi:cold shock protein